MKISQQLKEKNIAEYLIYMWQVEDLLRANKCDIDLIRSNVISRYPAEEHAALEEVVRQSCRYDACRGGDGERAFAD